MANSSCEYDAMLLYLAQHVVLVRVVGWQVNDILGTAVGRAITQCRVQLFAGLQTTALAVASRNLHMNIPVLLMYAAITFITVARYSSGGVAILYVYFRFSG